MHPHDASLCTRPKRIVAATRQALTAGMLAAGFLSTGLAHAGATLKISDDASISLGLGLRASYTSFERGAPNGTSDSHRFSADSMRIFTSGQFGKHIGATLNLEKQGGPAAGGGDNMRVLDAIAKFSLNDQFNVWLGRMLPPGDRANLAGGYFIPTWTFPGVVSTGPVIFGGRDDGLTIWGRTMGGKLVYAGGAFNGHNRGAALSNDSDKFLYAGRLKYDLWDAEPNPAYYESTTYHGSANILSLGVSYQTQQEGVGTSTAKGNYKAWSMDALFEPKMIAGSGVPTLEANYYKYDLGALDCNSGEPGAPVCVGGTDNFGGLVAGKAMMVSGAYLFPAQVGWGKFQPFVRLQKFDRDVSNTERKATDLGVNYVINGHSARITTQYTKLKDTRLAVQDQKQFYVGVQLLY